MKKALIAAVVLLVALVAAWPFLFPGEQARQGVTGLPWQIEVDRNGATRVFGVSPGRTTLGEAIAVLGNDFDLAIIAASGEAGALEAYYGHYRAGLIGGKLVLQAEADADRLAAWKAGAVKVSYMASGQAKKYWLDAASLPQVMQATVVSITFVPTVNLDEAVLRARFGEPAQRIALPDGQVHYLYPGKGLDAVVGAHGKDVLQYVAPARFEQLLARTLHETAENQN